MTDHGATSDPSKNADAEAAPVDNLFAMKVLVIFLGVILIGCAVAFFSLLLLMNNDEETDLATLPQMSVQVALDEKITSMTLDGRDLALQIEGPEGRRIIIVDPYTANHKAVINLVPELDNTGMSTKEPD
ncbi:MAG: hypothetical protein MRY59_08115 [Aquisalinus sp.]|nr:hypothetical protein [Aquisalinus sp.]